MQYFRYLAEGGRIGVRPYRPMDAAEFTAEGLAPHRPEADIQPGRTASIALVRELGFRREGPSPDFLQVDGAWRDHERWALASEMPCPGAPHRTG